MYTIDLTTHIAASPDRVWRALTNPDAVARWDTTVIAPLDAPPDYPQPGQHVRWRCRNTTELLHDHPQHVEPERRLHSHLTFGRQRLDETYTLEAASNEPRASSDELRAARRGPAPKPAQSDSEAPPTQENPANPANPWPIPATPEPPGTPAGARTTTTLHLHIELSVRAPFIAGPILLQLIDGPATRRNAEAALTNLKYYCELSPG
jgi:hypothetical protein